MRVEECMKSEVVAIEPDRTVRDAVSLMVKHHIGTLPVIDGNRKLIGVLAIGDLLRLFMPDFVSLLDEIGFVHDFGQLEEREISSELLQQPIQAALLEAVSVTRDSGLLRAFNAIHRHNLLDIPVVDEAGHLVGIASRTDIGTAYLAHSLGLLQTDRAALQPSNPPA